MLPRYSGLARIVPRKISLALPTTIIVRRDISNKNIVVYKKTRNLF
jgi:hypothetical protein